MIVGFTFGLLVVFAVGALVFAAKVAAFAERTSIPRSTFASTSSPTPSGSQPSPALTDQPPGTPTTSPLPSAMRTAEAHLEQGDGAAALVLLVPQLDHLTSAEDLARLNSDLAQAELLLGHFQRSAGYYESAFALDPSPEMLLELASAYDLGGDLHSALARYLRLAAWDGADEILRQIARDRARDIVSVLGTPTPGS